MASPIESSCRPARTGSGSAAYSTPDPHRRRPPTRLPRVVRSLPLHNYLAVEGIAMNRLVGILCLVAATTFGVPQPAAAGRIGGPMSEPATVAGRDTVYLDVPFEAGQPAVVTVTWQGQRFIELRVY